MIDRGELMTVPDVPDNVMPPASTTYLLLPPPTYPLVIRFGRVLNKYLLAFD